MDTEPLIKTLDTITKTLGESYEEKGFTKYVIVLGSAIIILSFFISIIPENELTFVHLQFNEEVLFVSVGLVLMLLGTFFLSLQNIWLYRLMKRDKDIAIKAVENAKTEKPPNK